MKQSEIKELSIADLQEKLGALQKNYTDLKMAHAITPLENPIAVKKLKKNCSKNCNRINKKRITIIL